MVRQYPDTIVLSWEDEPTQDPDTGFPVPGIEHEHTFQCRVEVNTRARKINGNDGVLIDYSLDVYMPKTEVVIPPFKATYTINGNTTGTVKQSKNGQLNSRLWL